MEHINCRFTNPPFWFYRLHADLRGWRPRLAGFPGGPRRAPRGPPWRRSGRGGGGCSRRPPAWSRVARLSPGAKDCTPEINTSEICGFSVVLHTRNQHLRKYSVDFQWYCTPEINTAENVAARTGATRRTRSHGEATRKRITSRRLHHRDTSHRRKTDRRLTANLRAKIVDFSGFDSSRIIIISGVELPCP